MVMAPLASGAVARPRSFRQPHRLPRQELTSAQGVFLQGKEDRSCDFAVPASRCGLCLLALAVSAFAQSSMDGRWHGWGSERPLRAGIPARYPACIALDDAHGTIDYPSFQCGGSPTKISVDQTKAIFRERITYGACIDGGEVTLDIVKEKLSLVWLGTAEGIPISVLASLNSPLRVLSFALLPRRRGPLPPLILACHGTRGGVARHSAKRRTAKRRAGTPGAERAADLAAKLEPTSTERACACCWRHRRWRA